MGLDGVPHDPTPPSDVWSLGCSVLNMMLLSDASVRWAGAFPCVLPNLSHIPIACLPLSPYRPICARVRACVPACVCVTNVVPVTSLAGRTGTGWYATMRPRPKRRGRQPQVTRPVRRRSRRCASSWATTGPMRSSLRTTSSSPSPVPRTQKRLLPPPSCRELFSSRHLDTPPERPTSPMAPQCRGGTSTLTLIRCSSSLLAIFYGRLLAITDDGAAPPSALIDL